MQTLDIEKFTEIEIEDPATVIINQIRRLIADGSLQEGVSLPSERVLAERFGVGRGHIRKALAKLEFYGILKTIPNRGTIVANLGPKAIEGLLSSILQFQKPEVRALLETRTVLEVSAASFAAERGSAEEQRELEACLEDFRQKAVKGQPALEEDHVLHLKIAAMAKNPVLLSLISLVTPDIIAMNRNFAERDESRFLATLDEHEAIVRAIASGDPAAARAAMELHMSKSTARRIVE